jgi:hypothetical protein
LEQNVIFVGNNISSKVEVGEISEII